MEPPQLRCAEAPMRTSLGAPVPMFVDESVGNIRIQECQELGGASRRKRRVHGPANYSLKLYLSAKSGEQHISRTTCLLHILHRNSQHPLIVLHLIPPIICSCRGDHDFVAKEANFFVTHNIDSSVLPHFGFAKRFQGPYDGRSEE